MKRVVAYKAEDGTLTEVPGTPGQEPGAVMRPLVDLPKNPEDCWPWIGSILPDGYGKKTFNGRTLLAHRWVWSQLFGPIPEGLVIDHVCQNTICVNPHHLRVVTQAENVRDGLTTLLTAGDVKEIRELWDTGWLTPHLATKFGVSVGAIKSLLQGKSWRKAQPFYGAKKYAPKAA